MRKPAGRVAFTSVVVCFFFLLLFTVSCTRSNAAGTPLATADTASKPVATASAPPTAPQAPPGTVLHVVAKGELLPHVVHKYWASSSYMSRAEMETAIRERNSGIKGI